MSELADRMGVERDFARRLSRLTARQRRELRELLGEPPDPSRVSAADWQRWEDERKKELMLILLGIFLASHALHADELVPGGVDDSSRLEVNRQALLRASSMAAEAAGSSTNTARDIIQASAEVLRTGTSMDIEGVLIRAMGPDRDALTAATLTTEAQTHGMNSVKIPLALIGLTLEPVWVTMRDEKVCAICDPLDGKPVDLWGTVLEGILAGRAINTIVENGGPPAHPRCRCYVRVQSRPIGARPERF